MFTQTVIKVIYWALALIALTLAFFVGWWTLLPVALVAGIGFALSTKHDDVQRSLLKQCKEHHEIFRKAEMERLSKTPDPTSKISTDPLREIKDVHGKVLHKSEQQENELKQLAGKYLRGAQLAGVDLRGANLRDADLRDANLEGSSLEEADLRGAKLDDANLNGAIMRNMTLEDTSFARATIVKADLRFNKTGYGVSFGRTDLQQANLSYCEFRGTNFSNASLLGANLRNSEFSGDFCLANLYGVNVTSAVLWMIEVSGADIRNVDFTSCAIVRGIKVEHGESATMDRTTKWPFPSLLPLDAIAMSSYFFPLILGALAVACPVMWLTDENLIPALLAAAIGAVIGLSLLLASKLIPGHEVWDCDAEETPIEEKESRNF